MKCSDLKLKIRKNSLTRRFLALLMVLSTVVALVLPGYEILLKVSAANEEDTDLPLEKPEDMPLAWFTFDKSDDRLENLSGNGIKAELIRDVVNNNIIDTESGNNYADSIIRADSVSENEYADSIIGADSVSENEYANSITGADGIGGNEHADNIIDSYSGNDVHNFFPSYDEGSNDGAYLNLNGTDAYLSLTNANGKGVLNGLQEMTIEMKVKLDDPADTNWAFFAAPDAKNPEDGKEQYFGILLKNDSVTVERYAEGRPGNIPTTKWPTNNGLNDGEWHIIRVVFKISSTILCVDEEVIEIGTPYSLKKCVGEDGILWFGHASWGTKDGGIGEGFNGCIDYIKIWDHAIYDPINEEKYIVTDRVTEPKYTTVNMFDYWITEQSVNDYAALDGTNHNALLKGINEGHLFLFAGETVFSGGPGSQATEAEIGFWNRSRGLESGKEDDLDKNIITQGIVQKTLGDDGYPALALDTLADSWGVPSNHILSELWNDNGKKTESLAYLFDPDDKKVEYKASYPNVTGLFRINDKGYYEFRSWQTFAELNVEEENGPKISTVNNHITLYNEKWGWGLPNEHDGQFFPFNDWSDMFFVNPSGAIEQAHKNYTITDSNNNDIHIDGGSGQTTTDEPLNHYFGMTVETMFQQPIDGKLDRGGQKEAMKFEFSGDDDVWIFIDDVLVGDLGGIHGWKDISIDFSTGEIKFAQHVELDTTLAKMFEAAKPGSTESWKKITGQESPLFPDNSIHTLKFFYLERGNQYSNCNITFNLQEPIVDRIRKVDENGDPLAGVEFELYRAEMVNDPSSDKRWHTADEFKKIDNTPMTMTTSDADGYAILATEKGEALQYDVDGYYILEETKTPAGYRKNPPIVLEYHGGTGTLTVVNKYETGAYASFLANWTGNGEFHYAKFADGKFSKDDNTDGVQIEKEMGSGLAIVVPVIRSKNTPDGGSWLPMYGSNTYGWKTVTPDSDSEDDLIKALAVAAIMQIADSTTQDWYLRWDGIQLKGYMENLPGDATRYVFNNKNNGSDPSKADGDLVTLFLPGNALKKLLGSSVTYNNDDDRYMALRRALEGKDAGELTELAATSLSDLKILYTDDFEKNNRTVIYVPNEQRELRVRKVDDKDNAIKNAVFALFDNIDHAIAGDNTTSTGVLASGKTDENGELIFRANVPTDSEAGYGYAKMDWDASRTDKDTAVYWLKEIAAPEGYELNESLIRVEVGNAGIYANATGFDSEGKLLTGVDAENDGIKVEASLGRLNQTMVKYAEGIVDETLKYITVTKQTTNSIDGKLDINAWYDIGESEDRIYDNGNGYDPVVQFTADEGYIRVMPRQTRMAEGIPDPAAKRDILTDNGKEDGNPINLDGLFSLINTVVVKDMPTDMPVTGNLTVVKTVVFPEGEEIDTETEFAFTVTLSDTSINGSYGDMTFKEGVATFTLKHTESKIAKGLPAGITYAVVEDDDAGYTAAKTGEEGMIIGNSSANAEFINTKNVTPTPGAPDTPNPTAPSENPETVVARDPVPQTGDESHLGLWLAMLLTSLVVMGISFRTLRRKRYLHEKEKPMKKQDCGGGTD